VLTLLNLAIGLGIFLFGMRQIERAVEALSNRWIRQRLAKSSERPISSVLSGTFITTLLQSSSMVSLLVLAFASAGVIPLYNAIGVLLGANLGTTFTGWIVATLGFKLDLAATAVPLIGLGSLLQVFASGKNRARAIGRFLYGLGLLLFGLSFMKEAVETLPDQLDLARLEHLNALGYLAIGLVLAAVIQSSSATMMIALAALNSGIIQLPDAAALVIGADIGTTSTTVIGSIQGSPVKRQLALAHFCFNLVVDLFAFVLLLPLLPQLLQWLSGPAAPFAAASVIANEPLYVLVAFHSLFNLIGLFMFVPVLKSYSRWISRRFVKNDRPFKLMDVPTKVPDAAIAACSDHTLRLFTRAIAINMRNLHLNAEQLQLSPDARSLISGQSTETQGFERRYEEIKQHEGEFLQYASVLQQQPLTGLHNDELTRLLSCAREAVYAVKTLKDVRENLVALRHDANPTLHHFSRRFKKELKPFYRQLLELLTQKNSENYLREQLELLRQLNEKLHLQLHNEIRHHEDLKDLEPESLSTLMNVNREVWHSNKTFIHALQYWHKL